MRVLKISGLRLRKNEVASPTIDLLGMEEKLLSNEEHSRELKKEDSDKIEEKQKEEKKEEEKKEEKVEEKKEMSLLDLSIISVFTFFRIRPRAARPSNPSTS